MAELYAGRVVRMPLGGTTFRSKERLLESALSSLEGVSAFFIDCDEGILTAYVDDINADEDDIVRALVASGMYPMRGSNPNSRNEGGSSVC